MGAEVVSGPVSVPAEGEHGGGAGGGAGEGGVSFGFLTFWVGDFWGRVGTRGSGWCGWGG